MLEIFGARRIMTTVGALAALAVLASWPAVVACHQSPDARKDAAAAQPTPEQIAAHRKALELRHAAFKAALTKARADGELASRAFLDKQGAELKAENAKVMAEIERLGGGAEPPQRPGRP
jgi:hypothetical protein